MKHDGPKRAERIGHFGSKIAIAGAIGGILTDLAYALIGPGDTIFTVLGFVCMPAFVLGVVVSALHNESSCLACMEGFPIEHAEAMAERHSGSLRAFHLGLLLQESGARAVSTLWSIVRRKPVYIPIKYAYLVANAFMMATFIIVSTLVLPHPWGTITFMTYVAASMVVSSRHRRLQPWCRWCRNDDDGDDDNEEVPDPDPATGKSLHA